MTVTRRCTRSGIAGASRSTRFRQAPIRQGRCGDDVRVTGSGGESSSGYALTDDFWLSFFETPGKTRSRAALDSGIALLYTGDFYGAGPIALLLKRSGRTLREAAALGEVWRAAFARRAFLGFDGRPAAAKSSLANSLPRLGEDHVDIYRPARLGPNVPIEETIGSIAELETQG